MAASTPAAAYCDGMTARPPSVLIIGAGFGGIGLGALLLRAGLRSFTILEQEDSLGGTWRDNIYPGAACDVPSHLYSYSFAPAPGWERRYAPQGEILSYLTAVADRLGVSPHIRYGCAVASLQWSSDRSEWTATLTDGRTIRADVVVSAVGQLHRPAVPDLPGLASFPGTVCHSSQWPADLDLTGRRVGVIGSAASAVQIVPALAPGVARLSVFQRSPNWILPRGDRRYRRWEQRVLAVPAVRRAYRAWLWTSFETRFPALRGRRPFASLARRLVDRHLAEAVPDPGQRDLLTPDFPVGARRVLSSDDYYPALARDNVDLVTSPVARIDPAGVVLGDGRTVPVDCLVLATGFRSTEFLASLRVVGRDGRELHDVWRQGAAAHVGVSVPGFPNFFMMYGPNTNLGHNSIIFMLECQARHIVTLLRGARHGSVVEVREGAFRRFNTQLGEALSRTVWGAAESSWYRDAAGRITTNWGYGTPRYWWATRRAAARDYRVSR